MKKRYVAIPIAILAVLALAAFSTPASAGGYGSGCPFDNWYNGTIHGGVYFQIKGHYTPYGGGPQTVTFEDVPAGRKIVRLYPGIWLGSPDPGRTTHFNLTINGHTELYNYTECDSYPCCNLACNHTCNVDITGCGVCSIYDVNASYIQTGTNTIIFTTSEQIYHTALLVIYENASMPEITYWVKEGHEYPDSDYSLYFNETVNTSKIYTGSIESLTFWTIGYPHCVRNNFQGSTWWSDLNGNNIDTPDYVYSYDSAGNVYEGSMPGKEYEVFYRWDNIPPEYISSPNNLFYYEKAKGRMMVPVLMLQYGKPSELNVSDISPESLCVDYNNSIAATIVNTNGTARVFTATLYVNGSNGNVQEVDVRKVTNLSKGESRVVKFLWKPDSEAGEDTYTLNVTVDVENVTKETDKTNNSKIKVVEVKTANPPQWSNQSSNVTEISNGGTIELRAQGFADLGLDNAVLSINETGTWMNITDGRYGSPKDMNSYYNYSFTHTSKTDWKAQTLDDNLSVVGGDVKLTRMLNTTNVALNEFSTADNNSENAYKANDGTSSSTWVGGESENGWWYVNFSEVEDIQQVKIDFHSNCAPHKYTIDTSNNAADWTTKIERSMGNDETFGELEWSCQYIRVNITRSYGTVYQRAAITEFEAFQPGDYNSSGTLTSDTITTNDPVVSVTPTWNVTNSTDTSISVNVSVDNGTTWKPAVKGEEVTWDFNKYNRDLKYRVLLATTNVSETPVLHNITLNYKTRDPVEGTWLWSNFTWHNASVTDTTVGWKIYYNDSLGVTNCTAVNAFSVSGSGPHTYDFSTGAGTDKWAFMREAADKPPTACNVPDTEFSPGDYDNIKEDEGTRQEDESFGYYAAHRFNFSISENPNDISKINVTWNGNGSHEYGDYFAHGANLSIWNFTAAAYELLQASAGNTKDEVTLTGEKTSSISSYINANNVTVLVEQKTGVSGTESYIKTDYVKVVITT